MEMSPRNCNVEVVHLMPLPLQTDYPFFVELHPLLLQPHISQCKRCKPYPEILRF